MQDSDDEIQFLGVVQGNKSIETEGKTAVSAASTEADMKPDVSSRDNQKGKKSLSRESSNSTSKSSSSGVQTESKDSSDDSGETSDSDSEPESIGKGKRAVGEEKSERRDEREVRDGETKKGKRAEEAQANQMPGTVQYQVTPAKTHPEIPDNDGIEHRNPLIREWTKAMYLDSTGEYRQSILAAIRKDTNVWLDKVREVSNENTLAERDLAELKETAKELAKEEKEKEIVTDIIFALFVYYRSSQVELLCFLLKSSLWLLLSRPLKNKIINTMVSKVRVIEWDKFHPEVSPLNSLVIANESTDNLRIIPDDCSDNHEKCEIMIKIFPYLDKSRVWSDPESPFCAANQFQCFAHGAMCQRSIFLVNGSPFGHSVFWYQALRISETCLTAISFHRPLLMWGVRCGMDINSFALPENIGQSTAGIPLLEYINYYAGLNNDDHDIIIHEFTRFNLFLEGYMRLRINQYLIGDRFEIQLKDTVTPVHIVRHVAKPVDGYTTIRTVPFYMKELEDAIKKQEKVKKECMLKKCKMVISIHHVKLAGGITFEEGEKLFPFSAHDAGTAAGISDVSLHFYEFTDGDSFIIPVKGMNPRNACPSNYFGWIAPEHIPKMRRAVAEVRFKCALAEEAILLLQMHYIGLHDDIFNPRENFQPDFVDSFVALDALTCISPPPAKVSASASYSPPTPQSLFIPATVRQTENRAVRSVPFSVPPNNLVVKKNAAPTSRDAGTSSMSTNTFPQQQISNDAVPGTSSLPSLTQPQTSHQAYTTQSSSSDSQPPRLSPVTHTFDQSMAAPQPAKGKANKVAGTNDQPKRRRSKKVPQQVTSSHPSCSLSHLQQLTDSLQSGKYLQDRLRLSEQSTSSQNIQPYPQMLISQILGEQNDAAPANQGNAAPASDAPSLGTVIVDHPPIDTSSLNATVMVTIPSQSDQLPAPVSQLPHPVAATQDQLVHYRQLISALAVANAQAQVEAQAQGAAAASNSSAAAQMQQRRDEVRSIRETAAANLRNLQQQHGTPASVSFVRSPEERRAVAAERKSQLIVMCPNFYNYGSSDTRHQFMRKHIMMYLPPEAQYSFLTLTIAEQRNQYQRFYDGY